MDSWLENGYYSEKMTPADEADGSTRWDDSNFRQNILYETDKIVVF